MTTHKGTWKTDYSEENWIAYVSAVKGFLESCHSDRVLLDIYSELLNLDENDRVIY